MSKKSNKKFLNKIKSKPYIIAEVGNHECSIKKAKRMILMAKKGGADTKFQTYKAELLASKTSSLLGHEKRKLKINLSCLKNMMVLKLKSQKIYNHIARKRMTFYQPFERMQLILEPMVPYFKIAQQI